jgi:hypothetical protein
MLGRRYNRAKKKQGGTGANQHKQSGQNARSAKTATMLAKQHGVNQATVRRAGAFADAVEKLKEALGHGMVEGWLATRWEWSARTANNFMAVARVFKSANFADLLIAASDPT